MDELIERLRSVKWEVIDDDDWDSRCVFVDMRPDDFEALLTEAAATLAAAQQRIACLPADWREDSSLETWFPFTAKQLAALQAENERLRAERDALAATLAATEAARDGYRDDARQLHAALVRMVAQYESEFDHEDTHKWRPEWLREALARTSALQGGGE